MIRYHCSNCDIRSETSSCTSCGSRADMKSFIYWCSECNVPSWTAACPVCGKEGKYISSEMRPVFPQERLLLELLLGTPMAYRNESVWFGGGRYIVSGKTIRLPSTVYRQADAAFLRKELTRFAQENEENAFSEYIQKWVAVNAHRYDDITAEAMLAIQEVAKDYDTSAMFVSFSGGKDSTVTSSLAIRALGNPSLIHLYGNTTLEFPESEKYIARFRQDHRLTPMLIAQNTEKNFYDMCDIIGPPSRVKRWCCTVFKTGAITRKIEKTYPGLKKLLSFQGIRRSESTSRNKYDRQSQNSKISKQVMFSPVIDWLDYDIWLYILTTGVDFNDAYRLGYTRVGCWCCPNNSLWSEFLSKVYMPEQYQAWREQLIRFAKQVGKPDPEDYIDEGGWKARQGGNGLEISKRFAIGFTPCATEENAFNYTLSRPITAELYELFKPFGSLDFQMGNHRLGEVYVLNAAGDPLLKLQGRNGKTELKVSILKLPFARCPRLHEAEMKIKCQLAKWQICLSCMACTSVCKHDAIKIVPSQDGQSYTIDNRKCIHCGECVNHFDGGCYMRDVIRTKIGDK